MPNDNPANLPALGFTHGGRFHADDVFSAAMLRILRPDIRFYRGFAVPKGFSGIVFDVGDGPFDHHAKGSPRRENGVAYAAFGLLWRAYGRFLLPNPEDTAWFDEKFIQPIDLDDNTGCGHLLSATIATFNPPWDSERTTDDAFEEAVAVAEKILAHRFEQIAAQRRGAEVVSKALTGMRDRLVVLPRYAPWKPVLIPTEAEFVMFPSERGGYSLQCVPKDNNPKLGNKVPLPGAWRGKPAEELQRITGLDDITFCHASGFMATVGSEESARRLCEMAREAEQKRLAQSAADRAVRP